MQSISDVTFLMICHAAAMFRVARGVANSFWRAPDVLLRGLTANEIDLHFYWRNLGFDFARVHIFEEL